ncbi:hypothetical protein JXA84_05700 [candidate division WOR-3 bacterium]|nr:hypothetical protein [candidate division WOR-3 bacterium]
MSFSLNIETFTLFKNNILSSNLLLRNSFEKWNYRIDPEASWSGKRNLVSGSLDEKYNFSLLSRKDANIIAVTADFSRIKNTSATTTFQTFKLSLARDAELRGFSFRTTVAPSLETYSARSDSFSQTSNPGVSFGIEARKKLSFINMLSELTAEIKNLTKKYSAKADVSVLTSRFQNYLEGKVEVESYPATAGRTRFNKYELFSEGRWDFFAAEFGAAQSYWQAKYYSKRYPESGLSSEENLFVQTGLYSNAYYKIFTLKADFSQGFGFHKRPELGDENILTSKLFCSLSFSAEKFSGNASGYMSIYRFDQASLESSGDYDVSDRGAGLNFIFYLTDRINAEGSFFYRDNRTIYLSRYYSESNTEHRTYSVSAGAFFRPCDFFKIRQRSTIKTDYTFFLYSSDKNVLFRKYENTLETDLEIYPGIALFFDGTLSIQDRGGYKKTDETGSGKWYFLRNRYIRDFDILSGVRIGNFERFIKPFCGIVEKAVFRAEGETIGGLESYSLKGYAGIGLEYSGSRGEIVLDLRNTIDNKGDDQWEASFYSLLWF